MFKKPEVTLTSSWDDGRILDIKVATILKKYSIPGTFYIILDYVGKEGYLTWDQIKFLDKQGFDIGSHSFSHNSLLNLHDEQLHLEVQNSKDMIETAIGHNISSFCYPNGSADERVRGAVANAGYANARGVGRTGMTKIEDAFYLPGTIRISNIPEYDDRKVLDIAKEIIDKVEKEGGYCHIWGESAEIKKEGLWGTLDEILKYASYKLNKK